MATSKKGLGRGLSALIPDSDMEFLSRVARGDEALAVILPSEAFEDSAAAPEMASTGASATEASPVFVEISAIEPNPYQPRRVFAPEEMSDLVSSVREHGVIQPILVRPKGDEPGRFQLIAGERRWRASQAAGLTKVPVVVRDVPDQQALELAVIENVQRHDISVMDAARAYRRLAQEFSLSQEDVAERVGKSRPAIANTMRLLDLPEEAQKAIEDGLMTEGHGRAILLAPGDGARRAVLRRILRDKVSVREAEELARRAQALDESAEPAKEGSAARLTSVELRALRATEEELSKVLGTRVKVKPRAKGGQITIEYFSGDDLDHLLGRLRRSGSQ